MTKRAKVIASIAFGVACPSSIAALAFFWPSALVWLVCGFLSVLLCAMFAVGFHQVVWGKADNGIRPVTPMRVRPVANGIHEN